MARFEINREWLQKDIYRSPELVATVEEIGQAILQDAIANAEEHSKSGTYARSFKGRIVKWSRSGRPYFHIWSDDPAVLAKEFGTRRTKAIRALGRAIGKRYS